ncbi:MAG: VOC family protein [Actinomycetota bacterium]|nr:VOC family protein [Actinomycetota bacterium]
MTTSTDPTADNCPTTATNRPRILPHLIYDDVDGAVAWLCSAFGFREDVATRHLDDDGRIQRTQLEVLDSRITLGRPSIHGTSPAQGVSAMLYVHVGDVDAHYAHACGRGARIDIPLDDAPWGDRRYQASDPEGHPWTFAQPLAAGARPAACHE